LGPAHPTATVVAIRAAYYSKTHDTSTSRVQAGKQNIYNQDNMEDVHFPFLMISYKHVWLLADKVKKWSKCWDVFIPQAQHKSHRGNLKVPNI